MGQKCQSADDMDYALLGKVTAIIEGTLCPGEAPPCPGISQQIWVGATVCRNTAAHEANGAYLLFLGPGVTISEGAVSQMVADLDADATIGAVGARLVDSSGEPWANEFLFVDDELRRRPLDIVFKASTEVALGDVAAVVGDALMVRKEAFCVAGGFAEVAGPMQSIYLCLALKQENWRCVFDARAVAICAGQPEFSLTLESHQKLILDWYGKVMPHGLKTPDGVVRRHPHELSMHPHAPGVQAVSSAFWLPWQAQLGPGQVPDERCSVVVVTYNSMKTIEACLTSVLKNLGTFDELLVVDNDSRDGTPDYLKSVADPRVKVILNAGNLGFSEGCNTAIREGAGDYIVLLNPDTEVYEGWLGRMRSYFSEPSVGAVGPLSNYVAGLQQYNLHLPTDDLPVAEVAQLIGGYNVRRGLESKLLIGFCMMIRRSALDKVGLLDPELFLGLDDLDISWRLRLAGYRLLIASDVFVRHEGQASFKTEPASVTASLGLNSERVLARKLAEHYGAGKVPSAAELWGIDWIGDWGRDGGR